MMALLAPGADAQTASPALNIFYSAKRMGNLDPCGCHSSAQGGVANEAAVVYPERGKGLPDVRVDAGQWMAPASGTDPVSAMQSRYLLLALEMMHYDALNFTLQDAVQRPAYFAFFGRQHPQAVEPIVSANVFLRAKPNQLAFKPYRIVERKLADGSVKRIGITGVTDVAVMMLGMQRVDPKTNNGALALTDSYAIKDPIESIRPVIAELKTKTDLILVLHAGNFDGAQQLIQAVQDITYVITSAGTSDPSIYFTISGAVIMRVLNASGQQIGLTTLRPRNGAWEFENRPEMIEVRAAQNPDPALARLVTEYNKISGKDIATTDTNRSRSYAGAHRCALCHAKIYQSWKATSHARAMDRLIVRGEQFAPDQLRRSTTGYGEPGGFVHPRLTQSQLLMGVQCEACHGPSLAHAEAETRIKGELAPADKPAAKADVKKTMPPRQVPEATCVKCHDAKFSPRFDMMRDYERVKH
ncbi:hypothetical protein LLG95_15900 [bacterium]|nr:hypothetical protein [bacterium]